MVAPAEQQDPAMVKLCPHWARFFLRPDGEWLAYCSEQACLDMDQARPGWRDRMEAPVAQTCQLGWEDEVAETSPTVITRYTWADTSLIGEAIPDLGHFWQYMSTYGLRDNVQPADMTDELWGRYIEAFLAWTPPAG